MPKQNAIANSTYALTADTTITATAGDITATLGNVIAGIGNVRADLGTVRGGFVETFNAAHYLSMQGVLTTATGTDVNIPISFLTKGTGTFNIDTPSGGISFRGLTVGFLATRWHTIQSAVQTAGAAPTIILTIPLANSLMVSVKALVNGFQDDYTDCLGGEIMVTAYRPAAGNIALVGAPIINVNYTDLVNTSDIDAVINVGTQSLDIQVIGVAAENWNWVATTNYMYTVNHL
jgi:hypothetical protein